MVQEYIRIFPMENIDVEDMADQSMPTKLVRKCGKDSMIPAVMAVDTLAQIFFLNRWAKWNKKMGGRSFIITCGALGDTWVHMCWV